ncbi:hypothetical protein BS47DRAFT_1483482 [Hydnum rufescens UP504]|uniref:NFACT RNA-binding domain-containing protein n=1 Tax=Hydnum rufescens UP504 TaxID=1448309 RepID=A0A9P6B6Q2_9AGAM|nr:hypothetical protein BS47DRAFT_1483482 [Hydnum rufescens UP504]
MVIFFTSTVISPPVSIYVGRDKEENEDLIKYGFPEDVWFHVDKLSSAHVYLRLPSDVTWDAIPQPLLVDCAQLVKANSIEGNKKNNVTVIYTPWANLRKTGDMATGQVSFHKDDKVKKIHISARDNSIINRLNKTKVIREVDHEAVRAARIKDEAAARKMALVKKRAEEAELAKARAAEKAEKSYDSIFTEFDPKHQTVQEMEDDFM